MLGIPEHLRTEESEGIPSLEDKISQEIKTLRDHREGDIDKVFEYDPTQPVNENTDSEFVRFPGINSQPAKSILKKTEPIEDLEKGEIAKATEWLSEAEDTALKKLEELPEQYFPQRVLDALEEFNSHLPDDRKLSIRDFIDHKALDIEGSVLELIRRRSDKGREPLSDESIDKVISQSVGIELDHVNLRTELLALKKDNTLSDEAKAEAAYRLLHEHGRELGTIRRDCKKAPPDKQIPELNLRTKELYQRNRLSVWEEHNRPQIETALNRMLEEQLEPFNRELPKDRQMRPQDFYDGGTLQTVMQSVRSSMVEKDQSKLDEFDLDDAIRQGLSEAIKTNPVLTELQLLSKDTSLSDLAKGEAMHRLINELGPQLQEIGGIGDSTERSNHYQALFTENRNLFV